MYYVYDYTNDFMSMPKDTEEAARRWVEDCQEDGHVYHIVKVIATSRPVRAWDGE